MSDNIQENNMEGMLSSIKNILEEDERNQQLENNEKNQSLFKAAGSFVNTFLLTLYCTR